MLNPDDIRGAYGQTGILGATAQHPHYRLTGQSRDQRPQRISAESVCPLYVVDRDHHAVAARQPLEVGRDAIDQYQWLTSLRGSLLEFRGSQQGVTSGAYQSDDRRAWAGLLDFIALASGDPDAHVGCLTADLREQRGLSNPGITRHQ